MPKAFVAIGLMSGTSLDGVDAALIETDGEASVKAGPVRARAYTRSEKVFVRRAIKAALEGRNAAEDIRSAENAVTEAHVDIVKGLLDAADLQPEDVDVVGFHGQTIFHRPVSMGGSPGRTWQIGDAQALATAIGIDVVADFRSADVAAGGEGAPLAPIYHAALARAFAAEHDVDGPIAIVNLGGVSNITFIPAGAGADHIVAFDCGPGNGLIDEWIEAKTGEPFDRDGMAARSGSVDEETLRLLLLNPYLARPAPKSLDRYDFKLGPAAKLSLFDGAATLTAFTAACLEKSIRLLPETPSAWIIAGGGRRNKALMDELQSRLPGRVMPAEAAGWRGDDLEAECFAYLAVRRLRGLPISFPKTTGAPMPMVGGEIFQTQGD